MKINWFTLIAQVINFLVLMWLLKRYLYKPILNAIDERENKIVAQLNEAETKRNAAEKEREEYSKKNDAFDLQKDKLMQKAIADTKMVAQKLEEEARMKANDLKLKLEKNILDNQMVKTNAIAQKIKHEVIDIVKKTLADLSSTSLEEQLIQTFTRKINELKKDEKEKFISTLLSGQDSILVQSAFQLSVKQQKEIQKTVASLLGEERQFQFKIVPELITGIELSSNGYKLSWSIDGYIKSLEESIVENTMENTKTRLEKE